MRTLFVTVALVVASAQALAAPRPGYIQVPRPTVRSVADASSHLIYLHRCPEAGCFIAFGTVDDSRTHTSSIAQTSTTIGAFTEGDAVWQDLVACVKTTYSPFNVTVTDVDPGDVPHFEEIIGGKPEDLRDDIPDAGGVAPFDCDEIPNGISFTFDVYGPDPESLCWTAAQETAHTYGLDHELLDADPMTYLPALLPKRFQDVDASCGEYVERACNCPNRPTQNSYQMILAFFGAGAPIPPTVAISQPTDGSTLQDGFAVSATATSIIAIDHVELDVDGVAAGTVMTAPYNFQATGVAVGVHTLTVVAYDVQGTPGSAMATVNVEPPCAKDKDCDSGDVCAGGRCVAGPTVPGGLGAQCTVDDQCLSMLCGEGGGGVKYCVTPCELGTAHSCPSEFACVAAGDAGVCFPSADGGCCSVGGEPRAAMLLGAGVVVSVLRRRKRRRVRVRVRG